jgi:cytochrome bd ubiquinol oxidase subunit I
MNEVLILSRLQFAATTLYHFLFVPLTLGLSIFMAFFETLAYRRKDEGYRKLATFFGHLFLINFAMGVVTGIVQEFQFGMNWSGYSRFVGDIFGAPLAIEALATFFLESTFLGIWIFGRDRLPKKVHLLSIWLVALGSNLSAYWILVANSFMQAPSGYVLRNGRAEMTDFFALIANRHVMLQFGHTFTAALTTAAFFMAGICAWKILKKQQKDIFMKGLRISAVVGLASILLTVFIGDLQGKLLVQEQPMKMAAAEALWESQEPAALSLFSIIDEKGGKNTFELAVPNMLSFLSYGNFTGRVQGIHELQAELEADFGPGNYIPPVTVLFWSFRIMVFLGSFLILAAAAVLWLQRKNRIAGMPFILKCLVVIAPIPFLCNLTGWMLTELGRQPWMVYRILRIDEGVTPSLTPGVVTLTVVGFILLYGVLAAADLYLMLKTVKTKEV